MSGIDVTFSALKWDTNFFKVSCAKVVLRKPVSEDTWNELKKKFADYQFVSIENRNSEPKNAQLIGKDTHAFLADVNIQLSKKVSRKSSLLENIQIYQALEYNEEVLELGKFHFYKFIEDPELAKRGGEQVYRQWMINSFGKKDKYYALFFNEKNRIDGFLLFSFRDSLCLIELIAVSGASSNRGIGSNLINAVEFKAYQDHCDEIQVGTQVRNHIAINFYHKVGFKQTGCHQIYHLWQLSKKGDQEAI
ncbi:MAG: GNAT family N-acetyltransferase [Candidatus Methanofastidiosa archaeon]|nr:GNAT family N-acetyltransferase [Candidatus Methanofastidiosa archaeon]